MLRDTLRLAAGLRRRRATRGNVTLIFAAAILPLLGVAGVAVDGGQAYLVNARLGRALDAAALAGARIARSADAEASARSYFDANFPEGYLSARVKDFRYQPDADLDFVTVSATVELPTAIMGMFGWDSLTVSGSATVERMNRGLELALVMDNTGSMRPRKIEDMKTAAAALIEILFDDAAVHDRLWVSLAPYTATVNVGADRTSWLRVGDPARAEPSGFAPTSWKGCVMARPSPLDESDDPPSVAPFDSFFWAPSSFDNDWDPADPDSIDEANARQNDGTGPNLGCGPAVTPLTNVKQDILDAIAEMKPWHRGGTTSNLGMVWGWRTISPRWRGLWGGAASSSMPLPYDEPLMDKAAILLTDGENQFYDWRGDGEEDGSDFTAYGRADVFATNHGAGGGLDERLTRMCAIMRAEGVIIYTITFRTPESVKGIYEDCAGDPANYFDAPTAAELDAAFEAIGERLSNLRVVE